jgi:hypothetical protein
MPDASGEFLWYAEVKPRTDDRRQRRMFDTPRDAQEQARHLMDQLALAGLAISFLVVALVATLGAS